MTEENTGNTPPEWVLTSMEESKVHFFNVLYRGFKMGWVMHARAVELGHDFDPDQVFDDVCDRASEKHTEKNADKIMDDLIKVGGGEA
ncbi:MAG: hypothetical protein GTN64_05605 [Candidatus Latescibacteria bacterium]|nr:hypothetical protein [Candidatus Latescibacterota bacterium]NIO78085.1 hypothetical protein [Candidatus Latescibacterota bacterium]